MKVWRIFLAIFFGLAGCNEDNIEPGSVPLGVEFSLSKDGTVDVDGINSKLHIKIENIYDSRCPANAVCIWEGNFGVDLNISDATQSLPVSLCNLFCGSTYQERDTVDFILNENSYSITLIDVEPYPGTTENSEPTSAILKVF